MSNIENINKQDMEGDLPGQQLTGEQTTAFQQLLRLQSDTEGQGHRVAMAVNLIAETLDKGGNVSLEMMNHVKAQILKAHLQLDELEQLLDSIDQQFKGSRSHGFPRAREMGANNHERFVTQD